MTAPITTSEWARTNGRPFSWHTALDNHEPTRSFAHGRGWQYDRIDDTRGPGIILDTTESPLGPNNLFLFDDGRTVTPYWVSGWSTTEPLLYLSPFPTNIDENGEPILRADGRPVDYSGWYLGPRKTFLLKIGR